MQQNPDDELEYSTDEEENLYEVEEEEDEGDGERIIEEGSESESGVSLSILDRISF